MKRIICQYCGKYVAISKDGIVRKHGYKREQKKYFNGCQGVNMKEYGIPCPMSGKKYVP